MVNHDKSKRNSRLKNIQNNSGAPLESSRKLKKPLNDRGSLGHEENKLIEQYEGGSSDENDSQINHYTNEGHKANTQSNKPESNRRRSKQKAFANFEEVKHKRRRKLDTKMPESTNPDQISNDLTLYGSKDLLYNILC